MNTLRPGHCGTKDLAKVFFSYEELAARISQHPALEWNVTPRHLLVFGFRSHRNKSQTNGLQARS